jgi:polyhydroxyalkanoate synthesis regulator protein
MGPMRACRHSVTQRGSACAILPSMRTVLIRRDGDNRLYDTECRTHVSLSDVADMLVNGLRIVVEGAATGEDITSEVLDKLH